MGFLSNLFGIESKKPFELGLKKLDPGTYQIRIKGSFPNKRPMFLSYLFIIRDAESGMPFLWNESPFSDDLPVGANASFPDWAPLAQISLLETLYPYGGNRKISFEMHLFEKGTVYFKDGKIQRSHNILESHKKTRMVMFKKPGVLDEIKNTKACKPLIIEIAMYMAKSDGSIAIEEGTVIKKWIQKEVDNALSHKEEEIKKLLNNALESSYKKLSIKNDISSTIVKFADIASNKMKYEAIELCLDVLSADGIIEEREIMLLEALSEKLDLDPETIRNMKAKKIINLSAKTKKGRKTKDETRVGMPKNLSKKDALAFVKKEYRVWNGRFNSLDTRKKRENAQKIIDALARLKQKYEN